jgi:hypothetical protein
MPRKTGPTDTEKRRQAARRAELRAEKKRAAEALRRKRSRAAKKGWETRRSRKAPAKGKKSGGKRLGAKAPKKTPKPAAKKPKQAAKKPKQAAKKPKARITLQEIAIEILQSIGIYPTREKAKRVVRRLTAEEAARFLRVPTKANWKKQARSKENVHYYDADGNEVNEGDGDEFNPFWYH